MEQSTHEIRRTNWLNIVNQCQNWSSDMSVKQWLAENKIKEKAYYYWLQKFRKEAYNQMHLPTAVIKYNGMTIELSNNISDALLKEIHHA